LQITGGGLVQGGITLQEDNRYRSMYYPPSPDTYVAFRQEIAYAFGYSASTTGHLSTATQNVVYDIGTGTFTIEANVYLTTAPGAGSIRGILNKGALAPTGWAFGVNNTLQLYMYGSSPTFGGPTSSQIIALNSWTYVAVVREGTGTNQTKFYINGYAAGSGTWAHPMTNTDPLRVGTFAASGTYVNWIGAITDLRWSNFARTIEVQGCTPKPFDSGTILVTGNTSTYAYALSANTWTNWLLQSSPSPTVNSNPLSVDVVTNQLNIGFGDYTIECWIYRTSGGTTMGLYSHGLNDISQGYHIYINSSNRLVVTHDAIIVLTGSIDLNNNTWYHIVVQRLGRTSLKTFVNGQQDNIQTVGAFSINFAYTYQNRIGYYKSGGWISSPFRGFISNFRISKGTRYPTGSGQGLTMPTEPFIWDQNTLLLTANDKTLSFTFDGSGYQNWTSAAAGSTTPTTTIREALVADFFPFST